MSRTSVSSPESFKFPLMTERRVPWPPGLRKKLQYLGSPRFPRAVIIVIQHCLLERVSGGRHGQMRSSWEEREAGAAAHNPAHRGSRVPIVWKAHFQLPGNCPPSMTGEFLSRRAPPGGQTWDAPLEEVTGNTEGKNR